MKVTSVITLNEKFLECDLTTQTENFYIKTNSSFVLVHNSPSLIAGWRGDEFVLTDKAGFSAKSYDGLTTSAEDIERMLMGRKMKDTSPQAMASRMSYARKIADLYPILRQVVPKSFEGYVQGDLLWTETPPLVDGSYEFKPVKIKYRVPANSSLGRKIARSQVGMVFHSYYSSPEDPEPQSLRNARALGFKETAGLVIVPHELRLEPTLQLNPGLKEQLDRVLRGHAADIGQFIGHANLSERELLALPGLMKSFVAWKAGEGSANFEHAPEEFLEWLLSAASKSTDKMKEKVLLWVESNREGYNAVWQLVDLLVKLKMDLKRQIDSQARGVISASLRDIPEHEGFVSVTPQGIAKLVNRAEFMKKEKPQELKEQTVDGPSVSWTFMRANPPTRINR